MWPSPKEGGSGSEFKKHSLVKLRMPYPLGVVVRNRETLRGGRHGGSRTDRARGAALSARRPKWFPYPAAAWRSWRTASGPIPCSPSWGALSGTSFKREASIASARRITEAPREKIIDLPFAHRIDFVNRGGTRFLIAATLAADKQDAADSSRPGHSTPPACPRSWREVELTPVREGIHRNHGLLTAPFMGRRSVLVPGTEGLFAADLDSGGADWAFQQVLGQEISEMAVSDIDGDGAEELVTIEPFHGNSLRVYKHAGGRWQQAWETELEYGHCLLAGMINGIRAILVSNRSGNKDLLLFEFTASPGGRGIVDPKRHVVDHGAGAANMLVVSHEGTDRIFSTNQAAGEIVSYTPF